MRKITVEFNLEEYPPKDYLIYLTQTQLGRIMQAAKKEMEIRYNGLVVTDIDIKTHKPQRECIPVEATKMDQRKAYHIIASCLGSRSWDDPENFTDFYSDQELRTAIQQLDLKSLQEVVGKFVEI